VENATSREEKSKLSMAIDYRPQEGETKSLVWLTVDTNALMLRSKTILCWFLLTLSIPLVLNTMSLQAQVIRIKVVNGKNGKPVANLEVQFTTEIPSPPWSPPSLFTDRDGEIAVKVGSFTRMALYTPSLKYAACLTPATKGHVATSPLYPVSDILSEGISMENNCGRLRVEATPGEIVYFVRPWTFWETLTYN
jgi:hypothetical protein